MTTDRAGVTLSVPLSGGTIFDMTSEFKDMLSLFNMGVTGRYEKLDHDINIDRIYELAESQGIWETVYLGLYENYDVSKYSLEFMKAVSKNIRRTEFIFNITDLLGGIKFCYLKGITVARFYDKWECRISSDTDILIGRQDMPYVRKVLRDNGFALEGAMGNMYHFGAYHKTGGLLEVHVDLYRSYVRDIIFKNMLSMDEDYIDITVGAHTVKTLGINDALNHLTAHAVKHFISEGAGVRLIMDLLLYMKHYENEIDWDSYNRVWRQIGFFELIEKFKGIGRIYWEMDFDSYDTDYIDDILTDSENGGLFGLDDSGRASFIDIVLAQKAEKDKLKKYMSREKAGGIIRNIFPGREGLIARGYADAKKGGVYILKAYAKRAAYKLDKIAKGEKKASDFVSYNIKEAKTDIEKQRLELMKKTGVI